MNTIESLYHYTSIEALYAIIQGIDKEHIILRGTHASFLNDLTEGQLLPQALNLCGVSQSVISTLLSCSGFPYIVSLCEKNDDLNMWRCYAAEGKGVTIEFKKSTLDDIFGENLKKCIYKSPEDLKNHIESYLEVKPFNSKNDMLPLARILHNCCIYKHISFKDENEWRIIKHDTTDKFRLAATEIVPYYEFKIHVNAIVSIKLGPKCEYTRNIFAIKEFLKTKGLQNVKVEISSIPLC